MKLRVCVCAWLALIVAAPLGAGDRLAMRVSPTVSFAPANLIVRTMVEADAANRAMEIVAESGDFYRSSQIQLDGDRAPRTSVFEFRSLPTGVYTVSAVLVGADGEPRARARSQFNVVESGAAR